MTARLLTLLLPVTAFLMASNAHAASFNCAKAKRWDEIAICSSQVLSDLDVEMATLYKVRLQLPMLMGTRGAAQDEQHQFLANRGGCGGDTACIAAQYRQRIDELRAIIDAAMQDYCIKAGICG